VHKNSSAAQGSRKLYEGDTGREMSEISLTNICYNFSNTFVLEIGQRFINDVMVCPVAAAQQDCKDIHTSVTSSGEPLSGSDDRIAFPNNLNPLVPSVRYIGHLI